MTFKGLSSLGSCLWNLVGTLNLPSFSHPVKVVPNETHLLEHNGSKQPLKSLYDQELDTDGKTSSIFPAGN